MSTPQIMMRLLIYKDIKFFKIDMEQIKDAFKAMFKQSLEKFIEGDTSGDYKKLLVALVD